MKSQDLVNAIEGIAAEIADQSNSTEVDFSVDSYNLIASIYEQLERSANALERIALAMEKK